MIANKEFKRKLEWHIQEEIKKKQCWKIIKTCTIMKSLEKGKKFKQKGKKSEDMKVKEL